MNVLLITSHFPPMKGGVESATKLFLDFLENRGIKSYTLTYENAAVAQEKFLDYWAKSKIVRIKVPNGLLKHMIDLRYISETPRENMFHKMRYLLLHEFFFLVNAIFHFEKIKKVDLIVGEGAVIEIICTYILSQLLRKKYVLRIHADITLFLTNGPLRKLFQIILSNAETVIVNGDDIKEKISQIGVPLKNIIVTHLHIDTNVFYPRNKVLMRKKYGLPMDRLIVIFAGALNLTKLCDFVMQVANIILEQDRNVVFLFIGEGPLGGQVNELTEKYPRNVLFLNKLLRQETLAEYLSASDVFLLGSVDVSYSSKIVLECLACGTPVIIPNVSIYLEKRREKIRFKLDSPLLYVLNLNPIEIAEFIANKKGMILTHKDHTKYKTSTRNYILSKHSIDELERHFDTILKKANPKQEG